MGPPPRSRAWIGKSVLSAASILLAVAVGEFAARARGPEVVRIRLDDAQTAYQKSTNQILG